MGSLTTQLRQVLRRLGRTPFFTAVALLTLAVGIGGNTAIFSVLEGVLLKPLPYPHAEELAAVRLTAPGVNIKNLVLSPSTYFIFREQNRTFQDIGLYRGDSVNITGLGEPERVPGLAVTDGLLPILGISPVFGRSFTRADVSPGSADTVMLTYGYWRRKFGGDRSVIGRTMTVDGKLQQIIGVLPQEFRFHDQRDLALILPLTLDRAKTFLGQFSYGAIARLKPGVSLAEANADVARMLPIVERSFPPPPRFSLKMFEEARIGPNLRPLRQDVVGDVGKVLWVLMGGLGMVLLIACANVANLLLVRAEGREQELSIRAALGASRVRIAAELFLDSLILALLGSMLGLALAYGALRGLVALAPAGLPRLQEIGVDGTVVLFTLALSLVASLLFGSIPVLKYAGARLGTGLRQSGRSMSESRQRHRSRSVLVVVQVALAVVLLISSGLMIRTFRALTGVDPGFVAPSELQTFRIDIPDVQVKDPERVVRLQEEILHKIEALPGVSSVSLSMSVPMDGNQWSDPIFVKDRTYSSGELPLHRFRFVAPGFFKTLGTPLIAGRDLTWSDIYDKLPVVIVSQKLAREYWHDPAGALGQQIRVSTKDDWREIVGVVGNTHDDGMEKEAPSSVYWPILTTASFEGDPNVEVRRSRGLLHSQPARRFGELDERGAAGRVVSGPQSSAGGCPHAGLSLQKIHGTDFVYPRDAGDRWGNGAVARRRGPLRRDRLFGVTAQAGDRHSNGARRPGPGTDANVCPPCVGADRRRCCLRTGRRASADPPDVVPAIRGKVRRPGNVRRGVARAHRDGRARQLPPCSPRRNCEPSGVPACGVTGR